MLFNCKRFEFKINLFNYYVNQQLFLYSESLKKNKFNFTYISFEKTPQRKFCTNVGRLLGLNKNLIFTEQSLCRGLSSKFSKIFLI